MEDINRDAGIVYQFINRCGGLPKVIVSVAGALARQFEWLNTARVMNDHFMIRLETRREFDSLRGVFSWMHSQFQAYPDFLRLCIFFLLIFPSQCRIRRRHLVMRRGTDVN